VAVLPEGDFSKEEPLVEKESLPITPGPGRDAAAEALPEAEARLAEGSPQSVPAKVAETDLVDSTVPLQVGEGGEILDLSLVRQDGHLEPSSPLVKSALPSELSEEIELPEAGIGIKLEGVVDQRSASVSGESVAFYPNVAEDSDLAISPTPTGIETMTQLRSAASPDTQTYRLALPQGATLSATPDGGANVSSGEGILLNVPAPVAIDAAGEAVPASLTVDAEGDTLEVGVEPDEATAYPVLVDPLFQSYEWAAKNTSTGICSNSFQQESSYSCNKREEWGYEEVTHWASPMHMQASNHEFSIASPPGIAAKAQLEQAAGDHATVLYTVPRYFKESPAPTSYIKSLKLSDMDWKAYGQYASPYLFMGIWDSASPHWVSYYTHTGQVEHGVHEPVFVYEFNNSGPDTNAKAAEVSINATESTPQSSAEVYVGAATVELGDNEAPGGPVTATQTQWVNQNAPPLSFTASDTGLGVYTVSAATEEVDSTGKPLHTWTAKYGCVGVGDSPCPRTWKSSESGHPALTYEPALLPSGIDYLAIVAEDPVGNKSSTSWDQVKVDHIAPTVALTGSMTEQDTLGTRRASYALKAIGSDGNAQHPQSGIASAEVKLDGKKVAMEGKQAEEWSPKCASENCPLSTEWALDTSTVAEGKHTIEVIATDVAGNVSAPQALTIETHGAPAPSLTLSGSMTEQATVGASRPRYVLKARSVANAAGSEAPTLGAPPTYASSLGSQGTGNGQFTAVADVAVDSSGNLWALDGSVANGRLQEFNGKGEWLRTAGAGMFAGAKALAIDANDNVWVADTLDNRVEEFSKLGEFVESFGTNVNKTKVAAGATEAEKNLCTAASGNVCQPATAGSAAGQMNSPKGIAVAPAGSIWVADTRNNRLEKFNPSGGLLTSLSGEGSEPGKLREPTAITLAPDGSLWVADTANNRIEQWNSSLAFVRAVGSAGSGGGQFLSPAAIEADSSGDIWVGDQNNNRIEEFSEGGVYLGKFGSAGSGSGQFNMSPRMGLTVDPKGSIWVADGENYRVQRWTIPGFPTYASSLGSQGTGNGQFTAVADVAVDSSGNLWALDGSVANGRLQEFNGKGEWLRTAGAGMFAGAKALAIDANDNVWVADTLDNRVEEFSKLGEFVESFGTNVNKTKVAAGATEAEKNLCTAASGNVCQPATAGSAAGQMNSPKGIAVAPAGSIWVADTRNNRLEKFNPSGGLLTSLSGEGSEPGKLREPTAITLAPDGSLWVADTANNRIEQWNSSLAFVRAVGSAGSGGGQFLSPAAIEADSSGDIWVGDQNNNRIEEFGEGGRYRGQFGANGSRTFSFSGPIGIAVDRGGAIWVTDPGHYKIQQWTQETPRSEITTTLWIDGVQQNGLHGSCKTATCTIEPQWTVESMALSPGSHTARVKTTDGLGRSTEQTLNFQIARDTTNPGLEVSGELFSAPEGWVEQEAYGLSATATDAGYGVTLISFKVDGQQVASASQACPDGGCKETLSKQISMASYSGGSHSAEVIATDGAGNSFVKRWTINVDPGGHISTQEVSSTLEAMEITSPVNPVGQSQQEPTYEGTASGLGVEALGASGFVATGSQVPATVGSQPSAPITLQILPDAFSPCEREYFSAEEMAAGSGTALEPEEAKPAPSPTCEDPATPTSAGSGTQTILVTPTSTAPAAGTNTPVEGNALAAANTAPAVDTITRPLYDGALVFQTIRDESGPTSFTWEVHLEAGQQLKLNDSQHATVYFASGHPAFSIAAEPASDAVGTTVPTELEVVSANLVTLNVKHREQPFVYPVLAGAGWEGGFQSVEIQGPKDEQELREERERLEQEEREQREAEEAGEVSEASVDSVGLEELVTISVTGPPEAAASSADGPPLTGGVQQYTFKHHFKFFTCDYSAGGPGVPDAPQMINAWAASKPTYCKQWINETTPLNAGMNVKGWWKTNQVSRYTWIPKGDLECNKFGRAQPALVHCLKRPDEPAGEGHEVHVLGDFRFPPGSNYFLGSPVSASPPACVTVQGRLANGPESHKEEPFISPSKVGDECNWP